MRYALNLDIETNRVLSVTKDEYGAVGQPRVETFPPKISDYLYIDGEFIYDPLPKPEEIEQPSQLDVIEAQVTYTAMMTDTLLEV